MEVDWNKSQIVISIKESGSSLAQTLKKLNFTRFLRVVLEEKSQQMQNHLKQESWAKELPYT